jgi:hypothetical protein
VISKKALHLHRTQRTQIKLQCYTIQHETLARESAGYIMIDVRLAPQGLVCFGVCSHFLTHALTHTHTHTHPASQPAKWYPLTNTKFKEKPELKIQVLMEESEEGKGNASKAQAGLVPQHKGAAQASSAPPPSFQHPMNGGLRECVRCAHTP